MGSREPMQSGGVSRAGGLVTRRRAVVAACLLALAAIALLSAYLLYPGLSADDQLAAIDAAHAVPDEQNAAKDYGQLILNDPEARLDHTLHLMQDVEKAILSQPWRSVDFPEAAKWVEQRRAILDALLQAGRKPKCWFSVSQPFWHSGERFRLVSDGSVLLRRAANNDFGEGRTEAGLEKLLCVFQMAEHLRSQLSLSDRFNGMGIASEGLRRLNVLLVTQGVPKEWLVTFEAALPPTKDATDEEQRQLYKIQELRARKYRPFGERMLDSLIDSMQSRLMRHMTCAYLSESRAARILLALRRYKDQTGAWPATLAEIEGQVPPEALIDPLSKKPFAYRPAGDSFLLYTVGPNRIDEGGESGDDYPFWPPSDGWVGRVKY